MRKVTVIMKHVAGPIRYDNVTDIVEQELGFNIVRKVKDGFARAFIPYDNLLFMDAQPDPENEEPSKDQTD